MSHKLRKGGADRKRIGKNKRHFCAGTSGARPPEDPNATRRRTRRPRVVHARAQGGAALGGAHWSAGWNGAARRVRGRDPPHRIGGGEDPPGVERAARPGKGGGESWGKSQCHQIMHDMKEIRHTQALQAFFRFPRAGIKALARSLTRTLSSPIRRIMIRMQRQDPHP